VGLTPKRDLRDGHAIWAANAPPAILGTRLQRSTRTDVVVVGAGISGAIIAQSLTQAGKRVLVVERRRAALLGSTAASTALLQFELDTPLIKLGAAIGLRKAQRVWIASRDAVNELRTRSHRLGIAAHFTTRPSLYLAGNVLDARGLKHEAAQRQRIGLASEYLDRQALRHHFGIMRAAALLNHGNAEANPVELAAGYLRHAINAGARFYAPHDIVDIDCGRRGTTLLSADGIHIHARHVIFCTGYELLKIVPASHHSIQSTWAIATRAQPRALWPQQTAKAPRWMPIPNMPMLWALREVAGLHRHQVRLRHGPVRCLHRASRRIRRCAPAFCRCPSVAPKQVTTIEGLQSPQAKAVQAAWIGLAGAAMRLLPVGQIMSATALLEKNAAPTDADIDAAMSGNICRCATYVRIRAAIHAAAQSKA
jgi:aerobic-type carbon monoxide dehydrogenase small subunit (CoxS/CutS family)